MSKLPMPRIVYQFIHRDLNSSDNREKRYRIIVVNATPEYKLICECYDGNDSLGAERWINVGWEIVRHAFKLPFGFKLKDWEKLNNLTAAISKEITRQELAK